MVFVTLERHSEFNITRFEFKGLNARVFHKGKGFFNKLFD